MAPIYNSTTGMVPQIYDSTELMELLQQLNALPLFVVVGNSNDSSRTNDDDDDVTMNDDNALLVQLQQLVDLLSPHCRSKGNDYDDHYHHWSFDEMVDLYDWIHPLNVIDSALSYIMHYYSNHLLLLPSYPTTTTSTNATMPPKTHPIYTTAATQLEQITSCPIPIRDSILVLLQFISVLLYDATSKHLFSSVSFLSDLLACSDDRIVQQSMISLMALSLPPVSYKIQSGPDRHHHQQSLVTQLHQSSSSSSSLSTNAATGHRFRSDVHDRLMCCARAYGTRTMGHGVYTIVTTDDSIYNDKERGIISNSKNNSTTSNTILPKSFGEIFFTYQHQNNTSESSMTTTTTDTVDVHLDDDEGTARTISLSRSEMEVGDMTQSNSSSSSGNECAVSSPVNHLSPGTTGTTSSSSDDGNNFATSSSSKKKRRKVITTNVVSNYNEYAVTATTPTTVQHQFTKKTKVQIKSTAELFFMVIERIPGGLSSIPMNRWYALLHDIRMARHYYTQQDRCTITLQRLYALITILHAHPSNETLSGYFLAQPDIGTDIADLLRPMVSSANISTAPSSVSSSNAQDRNHPIHSSTTTATSSVLRPDAITNLVDDTNQDGVPFELRVHAVIAISALITRRDGSSGSTFNNGGRLQSLLIDLGVGKGQYLGLLPTLIRYSLSAISSVTGRQYNDSTTWLKPVDDTATANSLQKEISMPDAFDIGLAFVEATLAPPIPRKVQVDRALRFMDSVLTLTSNVIGTSSGLTALIDCGLVPALISTVSIDLDLVMASLIQDTTDFTPSDIHQTQASLRYITAQAVQILEPVTVTSTTAIATFRDLKGVDVLVKRLDYEIKDIKRNSTAASIISGSVRMELDQNETKSLNVSDQSAKEQRHVISSRRSLVFCILTCLTMVFHQESHSETSSVSSAQLRTNELTDVLLDILTNVSVYGGYLTSLVTTLLSDAMNNDPHIISHVLQSGLAKSFLSMFGAEKVVRPVVPPVAELVMAIPAMISALALTDDGSKLVAENDPFPAFLRLFYHSDYAMPQSQCMLNEMASIVGTGLDEVVRHVDRLKPLVITAIANAMTEVVIIASDLSGREEELLTMGYLLTDEIAMLENERTCAIQYILSFGQIMEQVLHNDDNCEPFVEAGGFDALLRLFPLSIPSLPQFLPYVSSLSAPSVSTLHHSTTEDTLNAACKCIELRYNAVKVLKILLATANRLLDKLEHSQIDIVGHSNASYILDKFPQEPVYKLSKSEDQSLLLLISRYLRNVTNVQWITSLLANAFKSAYQRSSETSWSRVEEEWKNEITSESFTDLIGRLSNFHRIALYEVCRVRAEDTYKRKEKQRFKTKSSTIRYRLRIVCSEGAVVRDGIEIDSCTNVGSLEMGDIVESSDRCINASGILRYHTKRGWVSEMTRGHGQREPISEVINIWECENGIKRDEVLESERKEAGIPDIRSVAVAVLARSQTSCAELFSALSKLIFQGVRTLPLPVDPANGTTGSYISSLTKILVDNFQQAINYEPISIRLKSEHTIKDIKLAKDAGVALYLGSTLSQLNQCIFDEKRERRSINFLLLVGMLSLGTTGSNVATCQGVDGQTTEKIKKFRCASVDELCKAIGFVFRHGLADFSLRASNEWKEGISDPEHQRVCQSVASSFPPLVALLRKFATTPFSSSPIASIMSRLKWKDVSALLNLNEVKFAYVGVPSGDDFFHPESIMADLLLCMSSIVYEVCSNERIRFAPPHIIHPFAGLVGDIMTALKEMSKKKLVKSVASPSDRMRLAEFLRLRQPDVASNLVGNEHFEVSQESMSRLMEMGFSSEVAHHTLERTRSNQVENAMDHLLSATINRMSATINRIHNPSLEGEMTAENRSDAHETVAESEDLISDPSQPRSVDGDQMEVETSTNSNENKKSSVINTTSDILAQTELTKWIEAVPTMICNVLNNIPSPSPHRAVQASGRLDSSSLFKENDGDGESEVLTVVLCSFLLEMLHNYPEKRIYIVSMILSRLHGNISVVKENEGVKYTIEKKNEAAFSALCHAVVLLTRALPKCRLLVLEVGLLRKISACINTITLPMNGGTGDSRATAIPLWMTPSLLLLDVMALPIVAFSKEELIGSIATDKEMSELMQVKMQHREEMLKISKTADGWMKTAPTLTVSAISVDEAMEVTQTKEVQSSEFQITDSESPLSLSTKIPAYFTLLPDDVNQNCVEICRNILVNVREPSLSPGLIQSVLFLLLRLLRNPNVAADCLQAGIAEAILGLPKSYSFIGSSGVVMLILRRLLEDEYTLLTNLETEIRSIVTKLHAKKNSSAANENPSITLTSFMDAATSLLCRDPALFFKAMTLSVTIETSNQSLDGATNISLLSPAARATILNTYAATKILDASFQTPSDCTKNVIEKHQLLINELTPKEKNGSRLSRHSSLPKKGKKGKEDTPKIKKIDNSKATAVDVPASRITGLLIQCIVASMSSKDIDKDKYQFLSTHELIDILSDLIMAVPACAYAVHSHRHHRSKDKTRRVSSAYRNDHALHRCPSPPRTFITFLLHQVLPQDTWIIRKDLDIWTRGKVLIGEKADAVKRKKKEALKVLKTAQSAGRLLLALVLRPGEGRKRVVSDLTFALSGGRLGHGSTFLPSENVSNVEVPFPRNSDLNALQAWGELVLAIASPKNNGKNLDGLSALNLDNIRIMLECGMVHSLMFALHRIKTLHPMSANTYGAIFLPLEILTRGHISDAVESLIKKETIGAAKTTKVGDALVLMTEQAAAAELMLDVEMHPEADPNLRANYNVLVEVENNGLNDVDSHDMIVEDVVEEEVDDEERSSENSDEGDDDDESMDDSNADDIDDNDMSEESESEGESDDSNEVEDEADWGMGNRDSFDADGQEYEEDDDEEEEEVTEGIEDTVVDEEWTRVESNGGFVIDNEQRSRSRGFADAAEAMINSLFRNEDISNDALAEIEGTLGIRIMRSRNPRSGRNDRTEVDPLASRLLQRHDDLSTNRSEVRDVIGLVPRINQRSQPVVGYSVFGRNIIEISSMEYVFGGPTVTGQNRNYDVNTDSQVTFDLEGESQITQQDLQVFPNGPAVVLSARSHYTPHPMLCGVDLPAMSSLVSDLLPSGVRARRHGQSTTGRLGEWVNGPFSSSLSGHLFSTSAVSAIRSDRHHTIGSFGENNTDRSSAVLLGWTDDGLPVDNMVQELSTALLATIEERTRTSLTERDENISQDIVNNVGNVAIQPEAAVEAIIPTETVNVNEPSSISMTMSTNTMVSTNEVEDGTRSDGDGVVSSVAELRLSTENEDTEQQVPTNSTLTTITQSFPTAVDGQDVTTSIVASQDTVVDESGSSVEVASAIERSTADDSIRVDGEHVWHRADDWRDGTELPDASIGLVCPPDIDVGVFHSLPLDMQQDCVDQYSATQELAAQLNGSTLDPEVLAALPEEMRREVIEQDRQERRMRAQEGTRADPSNAEEMDNASFLASLSPDLREEILLTADEEFLNSLPPGVVAEAQILRERASVSHRRHYETALEGAQNRGNTSGSRLPASSQEEAVRDANVLASRRRQRSGKMKVDTDRANIVFVPDKLSSPFAATDLKVLFQAVYLLTPIQPPKLLHKIFFNLCANSTMRDVVTSTIVCLLAQDYQGSLSAVESLSETYEGTDRWKMYIDLTLSKQDKFPPTTLLGTSQDVNYINPFDLRQVTGNAASLAVNLPKSATGGETNASGLPPVIAARLIDMMLYLCKNPRVCLHALSSPVRGMSNDGVKSTSFEQLLELLEKPMFSNSSSNLETLLALFEAVLTPLSHISRLHGQEDSEISQRDIEATSAAGKEYVDVPQVNISQRRLQLLCSILRMESCRDTAFTKVNTIIRRLCRIETNRGYVLEELASVAHALGGDALRDLRALRVRMDNAAAAALHHSRLSKTMDVENVAIGSNSQNQHGGLSSSISSSVTLSTSTSETKLLRVLQTLQVLCNDNGDDTATKKHESTVLVTEELAHLLRQMKFDDLWDELSSCLKVVQVLEGVRTFEEEEQKVSEDMNMDDDGSADDAAAKTKKLRNTAAGLLSRFLPSIEAFFIANACATRPLSDPTNKISDSDTDIALESLIGGQRMLEFVSAHRVLVNALIRNNYSLLEKGFRALVQVPRCRIVLDFDVKRQWFKSQVRRLRQHASRRHGSLRLHIRRKSVFEDAYHQLQPRNADEMRGRLHVTFRNEEGVDAGGLSREFFGILAKEMFNPNYALFTSTEDGCTFQPNPNSMINPDHLSYFRFVGRVVGKAVADGYLLDAHFTRSLYKHMLGIQPTHHDMEAIDPDYYRNLKTILEFNLTDIGLDLTFSIEDHSFGRSQVIDLLPNGRSVSVTEETKEEYVRLVCQHRMTIAIQSQIKSYLAGFYELVSLELIAIFSPRELELLISGLPDIDVHDLKKHTEYVGWKSTDKEIIWFWNIVFGLSRNEKASFLQFVTGSSKVPLSGFAELQGMRGIQKFSIHKMTAKKGALMSAHTCFNSLDLPSYDTEDEMRQKFLFAINEGGGAFLFA